MMRSLRPTRSTPTISPKTWAAGTRSKTCATAPGNAASASRQTWSPTTWASTSKWVIEHPDWFLSLPYSPYPNYTFDSENLSDDSRAAIVLEDHYYDHSDAAVTFKLHHYQTNQTRFVYHGNDGTSMPWNDTAQLDFSKPEVREAVIQTILHVARNFPVIRFDAAMTLAKKHIQRLWFPEPGGGGAIPVPFGAWHAAGGVRSEGPPGVLA